MNQCFDKNDGSYDTRRCLNNDDVMINYKELLNDLLMKQKNELSSDEDNIMILEVLEKYHNMVKKHTQHKIDTNGWYPLHIAIRYDQSENIIMKLIKIFPNEVYILLPKSRCSVLKLALCSMIQSSFIIRKLIEFNPKACKIKDSVGEYPIYYAIEHNQSDEIIQHILNVMMTNYTNYADLLTDLLKEEDTAIDALSTSKKKYLIALQQIDRNGDYPLHVACHRLQSTSGYNNDPRYGEIVIMKLIQLYPIAVTKPDKDGYYPLHIVCRYGGPDNVIMKLIMKLIEIFPEAAVNNSFNEYNSSALNFACLRIKSNIIIQTLIELHPQALQQMNKYGDYPIHQAIEGEQSNDIIQLILNHDPLAIQRKNGVGRSPLHFSSDLDRISIMLMENMVRHSDININMTDKDGLTPLHYACSLYTDYVVECLLQYPDIDVNAKTFKDHFTPLHYAVKKYHLRNVQKLLHHSCIVYNEKDIHNETPFDIIKCQRKQIEEEVNNPNNVYSNGRQQKLSNCLEITKLLKDFPVKRRWQAFQYLIGSII